MTPTAAVDGHLLGLPDTLPELLAARVRATPDRVMLVEETGRRRTFAQVAGEADDLAEDFRRLGVGVQTRVAWQLPTWHETVVVLLALSLVDAVQVPIPHLYRAHEIGAVLDQASPELLLTPARWRRVDFAATARELAPGRGLRLLTIDRAPSAARVTWAEQPLRTPPAPPPRYALAGDRVRWVFLTSGTSSAPKGVQHTDRSVGLASLALARGLHAHADDRAAVAFPMAHVGGLNWITVSLLSGASLLLAESFGPEAIAFFDAEDATLLGAGTAHHLAYRDAARARPESRLFRRVRAYPGGGSTKPPSLMSELRQEIGGTAIVSGYGMTEHPMIAMSTLGDPLDKLAHTEGRPTPGTEVQVRDLGTGEACSSGQDGEIWVRGPHLFAGYLDPVATADAMTPDGLLRTGDVGHLDADGYVVITGRTKDVIIRKGENISVKEVEDLLYAHPDIADVAVVGLPDPALGERCCAVVVARPGSAPPDVTGIAAYLRERGVMPQKWPEQVEVLAALPRNAVGKVLKARLVESLAGLEHADR
jgi:acyl-CoA synthetase (AMP-forming)/AMP-acid ligase II